MNIKYIIVSIIATCLFASVGVSYSEEVYSVAKINEHEYTIKRNDSIYSNINLNNIFENNERLTNFYNGGTIPEISPNLKYLPFAYRKGPWRALIIYDIVNQKFNRYDIPRDYNQEAALVSVKWVSESKVKLEIGRIPYHIVVDIDTGNCIQIDGEWSLIFDKMGNNYCSLWGEDHLFSGSTSSKKLKSLVLRYNGFWVYPITIEGFVNIEQRDIFYSNRKSFPDIRKSNYGMNRCYALSKPTFISDTTWVGFIEQVYPYEYPNTVLETNIVVLDGHNNNDNPPSSELINTNKIAIPEISIDNHEYYSLSISVVGEWNEGKRALEFWQYKDKRKVRVRKICEVYINTDTLEFGEYKSYPE